MKRADFIQVVFDISNRIKAGESVKMHIRPGTLKTWFQGFNLYLRNTPHKRATTGSYWIFKNGARLQIREGGTGDNAYCIRCS